MGNKRFVVKGWGKTNKGVACPKMGTGGLNMVLPLSTTSFVNWPDSAITELV